MMSMVQVTDSSIISTQLNTINRIFTTQLPTGSRRFPGGRFPGRGFPGRLIPPSVFLEVTIVMEKRYAARQFNVMSTSS